MPRILCAEAPAQLHPPPGPSWSPFLSSLASPSPSFSSSFLVSESLFPISCQLSISSNSLNDFWKTPSGDWNLRVGNTFIFMWGWDFRAVFNMYLWKVSYTIISCLQPCNNKKQSWKSKTMSHPLQVTPLMHGKQGLGLMAQLLAYSLNCLHRCALWTLLNPRSDFVIISHVVFAQRKRLEHWT